ncbi:MAG: cytochrome c oxidase subunit 3 [Siphonobacter sp.]
MKMETEKQETTLMTWLTKRREPFQFMLELSMLGSVLIFAFILLVYLFRSQEPNWQDIALPRIFWLSTALIIISSGTLYSAWSAFRNEHFLNYRIMLGMTFALGLAFVVIQIIGWSDMLQSGIRMEDNIAAAFIYMISGLHVVHILGGLFFLGKILLEALQNHRYLDAYVYSVNPPNQLRVRLTTLFWHFVDGLWILLFLFLLYHHRR